MTARAARRAGLRVDVEAREHTVDGLLTELADYWLLTGGVVVS